MSGSKIFCGYKNLGAVSNHIPLCTRYIERRREHLIATVSGKVFNTYGSDKLRLQSVSPSHPSDITCLAVNKRYVFTVCENVIRAWLRGVELVNTYEDDNDIKLIIPLDKRFLISVNENNYIKKWNIKTKEICWELVLDKGVFEVTTLIQPNGYWDVILVGSKQGKLQIWDVNTSKLERIDQGWNSEITVLEQSPKVNEIGVGLASGEILIHDFKEDKTVMKFKQEWGPVLTISFRLDGQPLMTTGSTTGHIAIWDLGKMRLVNQIRKAHSNYITGMKFLPQEPLLITSSPDNSIKMWIFDQSADGARLLRQRQGHSDSPTFIRFYGKDEILSASQDSTLQLFSIAVDALIKSMGTSSFNQKMYKKHGNNNLKLPIICFDAETTREREWDNVVACHRNYYSVSTWSTHKCKMGSHFLQHERFKKNPKTSATCVALTKCGNFAVIGYDSGHVDLFNVQSGLWRGSYGKETAHKKAITGVAVDSLNSRTFTSSLDGILKYWQFKTREFLWSIELDDAISRIILQRNTGFLACILDNFSISILNGTTDVKVSRILKGHTNRITDACFSASSSWLITASMDSTICTWDLKNSVLIDCFSLTSPCISLCMSPDENYLATCHIDELAIYLWEAKTYSDTYLPPLPQDYQPEMVELPCSVNIEQNDVDSEDKKKIGKRKSSDVNTTKRLKISDIAIPPDALLLDLSKFDIIKERNKPKAPPKKPVSTPFFLPSVNK